MKRNKLAKKLTAGLLTGAMILSMGGMTAFATNGGDEGTGGETTETLTTFTFKKKLDMTGAVGANVPDVMFDFSINSDDIVDVEATDETLAVYKGVGAPTITDPDFNTNDSIRENKIVEKDVTVDFSEVTFSKPGIYRYKITEADTTNADITNDSDTERYLDVYVVYNEDETALLIQNYVMLKDDTIPDQNAKYGDGVTTKSEEVINTYTTYDLTLSKKVTGAMGNKSKDFDFDIVFKGPEGASFTVTDGSNTSSLTLDKTSENYDEETDTYTFSSFVDLHDDESVTISGIPSTVTYQISEVETNDAYEVSYKVNNAQTSIDGNTTGEIIMGKDNNAVEFTNNKVAVTPTGIAMTFAPYAVMVAFAGVFAVMFLRKKREDF